MNLTIATAMCGAADITEQFLNETVHRCAGKPEVVICFNGCEPAESARIMERLEEQEADGKIRAWRSSILDRPAGSTVSMNSALSLATGYVVAMLHNDLMVRQTAWDYTLLRWFEQNPGAGIAGFHGSAALGQPWLYQRPYELVDLVRAQSASNLEDAEAHGARHPFPIEVVTLDGMALIARRADLLAWGGLDERYVHHMYDHDLCLTARAHGRKNYMLPIVARHISGQTANTPRYNDAFADRGRDQGIHAAAHLDFYEKWRGTGQLPARV